MKNAIFISLIFCTLSCYAQTSPQQNLANGLGVGTYKNLTINPSFIGGQIAMNAFIRKNIKNTSGFPIEDVTVVCKATIDSTGKIQEIIITGFKGNTPNKSFYTAEAIRVVKLMPLWAPATRDGKPISMAVAIPIKFKDFLR